MGNPRLLEGVTPRPGAPVVVFSLFVFVYFASLYFPNRRTINRALNLKVTIFVNLCRLYVYYYYYYSEDDEEEEEEEETL